MKNYDKPQAVGRDTDGKLTPIVGATYDTKTFAVHFQTTQMGAVAVLASQKQGPPLILIISVFVMLVLAGGVAVWMLRRNQVRNYDEYMRSKYYNF
jgi:hypothetical protein